MVRRGWGMRASTGRNERDHDKTQKRTRGKTFRVESSAFKQLETLEKRPPPYRRFFWGVDRDVSAGSPPVKLATRCAFHSTPRNTPLRLVGGGGLGRPEEEVGVFRGFRPEEAVWFRVSSCPLTGLIGQGDPDSDSIRGRRKKKETIPRDRARSAAKPTVQPPFFTGLLERRRTIRGRERTRENVEASEAERESFTEPRT